ncbi:MAG TPA: DUF2877 domain-containing protein [Jiangellaceae bacterium]|nr:DUF2877 domain-containing protein [Jiangellaceae bacterium]
MRAAASIAISALIDAPAQPGKLIGSFPVAIYVQTAGGVVALVAPGGVRLPNAVALARADHATAGRHAGNSQLWVGDGGVQVGSLRVTVGRWWDPVPRLGRLDSSPLAGRLDVVRAALPAWPEPGDAAAGRLRTGHHALASALTGGGDLAAAVRGLVGLGAGLTPAGDDLLAGAMAGLVVFGTALERSDASALARDLYRVAVEHAAATTALAADLVQHAARGALVQPAADLCRAIADRRPNADSGLMPALERLLRLGHTSGRDLAEGLLLGASAALSFHPAP